MSDEIKTCLLCSSPIPLTCSCSSCVSIYNQKKFCSRECTIKAGQHRSKVRNRLLNKCQRDGGDCWYKYNYEHYREWPKGCARCESALSRETGLVGGRNG